MLRESGTSKYLGALKLKINEIIVNNTKEYLSKKLLFFIRVSPEYIQGASTCPVSNVHPKKLVKRFIALNKLFSAL